MKLPEPKVIHQVSLERYGMAPFDVRGYTAAQMREFYNAALEEAAQLFEPAVTPADAARAGAIRSLKELK